MNTKKLATSLGLILALGLTTTHGAVLTPGYTIGAGSELLTGNGGAGGTLFNDSAATGGENDPNDADGFATFFTALLPGTGLWNIGDTVSITGVALAIRGNTTAGTFTFDIREAAGGSGTTGGGGLDSLGTATASYADTTTAVHHVNFDSPVTFVVDSNSTSIGINIANSGAIGLKTWNGNDGTRLLQYNYGNGNTPGNYFNFSVAGSVTPVPEPATWGLILGAGALVIVFYRRRRRSA